MQHKASKLDMGDGVELAMQAWKPDVPAKAILVITHGLAEHMGRYAHVADYFVQQSYAVYGFDDRGHGDVAPDRFGYFERFDTLSEDLRRFIEWTKWDNPNLPVFLLGHSMGGLLALYYTVRYQPSLAALVVSAPLLVGTGEFPAAQQMVVRALSGIVPKLGVQTLDSATISRDPAEVYKYDHDPRVYRGKVRARVAAEIVAAGDNVRVNLTKISLPILIMHGSADRLVKPEYSQIVYDRVSSPDKTIKFYEGLYHEILNEPEHSRVMADIAVWLAMHRGTGRLTPHEQSS